MFVHESGVVPLEVVKISEIPIEITQDRASLMTSVFFENIAGDDPDCPNPLETRSKRNKLKRSYVSYFDRSDWPGLCTDVVWTRKTDLGWRGR